MLSAFIISFLPMRELPRDALHLLVHVLECLECGLGVMTIVEQSLGVGRQVGVDVAHVEGVRAVLGFGLGELVGPPDDLLEAAQVTSASIRFFRMLRKILS